MAIWWKGRGHAFIDPARLPGGHHHPRSDPRPGRRGRRLAEAAARPVRVVDLGSLGGGETFARDVNQRGQVTGYARPRTARTTRSSGTAAGCGTGTLGGENSIANDISDAGYVTGYSDTAAGERRAFLWRDGHMTEIGTLGGSRASGGTSTTGPGVGQSELADGSFDMFAWRAGGSARSGRSAGPTACSAGDERPRPGGRLRQRPGERHRGFSWFRARLTALPPLAGDVHSQARPSTSAGRSLGSP
jgi:probable HAF family extracellular repeat protein